MSSLDIVLVSRQGKQRAESREQREQRIGTAAAADQTSEKGQERFTYTRPDWIDQTGPSRFPN